MTAELIIEVWSLFKDKVSAQEKHNYAIRILEIFEENGVYPDELDDLLGQDNYIDKAYKEIYDEEELEE